MIALEQIDDNPKDQQIDQQEIEQALKPNGFLTKEENIKNLTNELTSNTEIATLTLSLKNSLNFAVDKILSQTEISESDISILNLWNTLLWESDGGKKEEVKWKIVDILDLYNLHKIIDSELASSIKDYSNNLVQLWVNTELLPTWSEIIRDINTIEDINKINDTNIGKYINIWSEVPKENYPYIVSNFQQILAHHLMYNPSFKSIFGTWWFATGMKIEQTQKNSQYLSTLVNKVATISKEKNFITQIDTVFNTKNHQIFDLWLKKTIHWLSGEKLTQKIWNIFNNIVPWSNNMEWFYTFWEKNNFIKGLVDWYIMHWANKKWMIKTDNKSYELLDWKNQSYLSQYFYKKWSLDFDTMYGKTRDFYIWMAKLWVDTSIPIEKILAFNKVMNEKQKQITSLIKQREDALSQVTKDAHWNMWAIAWGETWIATYVSKIDYTTSRYDIKIQTQTVELEKAYVQLLLLANPRPRWTKQGISWQWIMLDFSKWTTPDDIVRNSFIEQVWDQWDKFKYDMNNDRQAAFGSAIGMLWWIWWSVLITAFTKNLAFASAGFTAGLRIWNGFGQEYFNMLEFIYEKGTWTVINDWNNKVDNFGDSFLRGAGITDKDNEYVWTEKLLIWLWFDYISSLATFWLSDKFAPILSKLWSTRMVGKGLKFGMEELVIENFLVDIPMNIVQTWVETYEWISDGSIISQTALWNEKSIPWEEKYPPWSLRAAILAMQVATKKNLSFENLSQTFFSTLIYGWLLEWWWAGIDKIKTYLPITYVNAFESTAKIAWASIVWLTTFMTKNNISFNQKGVCIDTKTGQALLETDPRIEALENHFNDIELAKQQNLEMLTNLLDAQQKIVSNPNSAMGILFKLWLISANNTPINILNNKLNIVEVKLLEAQKKWDKKTIHQLNYVKSEYEKAKIVLSWEKTKITDISTNVVQTNATLEDWPRLQEAEHLLWKEFTGKLIDPDGVSTELGKKILDAHNQDGTIYNLNFSQWKARVEIVEKNFQDTKIIEEITNDQNVFETDIDMMTEQEQITLFDKIKTKIFTFAMSLSGKNDVDIIHEAGAYVVNNIKHFLHESKMVFGIQLIDVYKSYVQMKNNSGKPGDVEFQTMFQSKIKERSVNLTKLVGVGVAAKLWIDPNLFFWSWHLVSDQLQQNIPFFDKLFGLSFDTMNVLYSRKKGKNTMYNPQTVIENSLLDSDMRRQKIANELGLDMDDKKNQLLLDALQKAHETWQNGPGKNPEYTPWVYNYTAAQIRQKMEILKPFIENGSITLDQVRTLFEHGYLWKNSVKVDANTTTDADENTTPEIKSLIEEKYNGWDSRLEWVQENMIEEVIIQEKPELREIAEESFQNIEWKESKISDLLQEVLDNTNYNSAEKVFKLMELYEANKIKNPKYTIKDAFNDLKLDKVDQKEGTNCEWMSKLLQEKLRLIWVESYLIWFKSWWTLDNGYTPMSHAALIIPRIINWKKYFTLLDPGLIVRKPITFCADWTKIEVDMWNGKTYSVEKNSDPEFPFVMYDPKWRSLEFNPHKERRNSENTLNKDLIRIIPDYKRAKLDTDGSVIALLRINIDKETVDVRLWSAENTKSVLFKDFAAEVKNNPEYKKDIERLAKELIWSENNAVDLITKIENVIKNIDEYKSVILTNDALAKSKETKDISQSKELIKWNNLTEKIDYLYEKSKEAKKEADKIVEEVWKESGAITEENWPITKNFKSDIANAPIKWKPRVLEKIEEYKQEVIDDINSWKLKIPEWIDRLEFLENEAILRNKDIVRSSLIYETKEWVLNGLDKFIRHNSVKKYKFKNRLHIPWVRDILMTYQLPNWYVCEIQFHVREFIKAKEDWYKLTKSEIDFEKFFNEKDGQTLWALKEVKIREITTKKNNWLLDEKAYNKAKDKIEKWGRPKNNEEIASWHDYYDIIRSIPEEIPTSMLKKWVTEVDYKNLKEKLIKTQKILDIKANRLYEEKNKPQ